MPGSQDNLSRRIMLRRLGFVLIGGGFALTVPDTLQGIIGALVLLVGLYLVAEYKPL